MLKIISPESLKKYLSQKNTLLLDLRDKTDYDKEHIAGAVWADWETLENEIDKFVPKTSGDELTIILYCDKGTISLLTGRDLSLKGYNVISLKGGYDGLKEKL